MGFFLVAGYLIFRSGYLPRFIGVLYQIAGLGYVTNTFVMVLAPGLSGRVFRGALPSAGMKPGRLPWLGWVVVLLAVNEAGWLAFDGGRALVVGDYVTPASGEYAGQLGPWAEVVSAAGIEPRSTLMKSIHVGLGGAWLIVTVAFVLRRAWAWWGMLACAAASLWYLPFGTLLSLVQTVLLLLPPLRRER